MTFPNNERVQINIKGGLVSGGEEYLKFKKTLPIDSVAIDTFLGFSRVVENFFKEHIDKAVDINIFGMLLSSEQIKSNEESTNNEFNNENEFPTDEMNHCIKVNHI